MKIGKLRHRVRIQEYTAGSQKGRFFLFLH